MDPYPATALKGIPCFRNFSIGNDLFTTMFTSQMGRGKLHLGSFPRKPFGIIARTTVMPRCSGVKAIELVGLTVVACAVRAVCGGGGHPVVAFLHTPRAAPGAGVLAACPLRRMRTGFMNLQMSLEDEISSVRSMKVAEIKRELSQRGLATDDMFEKEEFVRRLAQARLDKVPRSTAGRVPHARRARAFDHSRAVLRAHQPLIYAVWKRVVRRR